MRYRSRILVAAGIVIMGLRAPDARSAPNRPAQASSVVTFQDGISVQYTGAIDLKMFARQADGTYTSYETPSFPPNTVQIVHALSSLSALIGGSGPAAPAGTGQQSQIAAISPSGEGPLLLVQFDASDSKVVVTQISTGSSAVYPVGQDVNSLAFADFNHDGIADLAVAFDGSGQPGGIAVLLGKSGGTFASAALYASGTPATHFAILDLNNDGFPDIATVALNQTLTVLLGKGDGTFAAPASYAVGGSGQAIVIADFDGDGKPDIVTGGSPGIMLGDGAGNFHPGPPLPAAASGSQIWNYAAGDLDGDGKMDLVYADISNQVVVPMPGNGDGTFNLGQAYDVSQLPDSIVLADFNSDGRLDIINGSGDQRLFTAADPGGNTDILLNNGDGTFQGAAAYFTLPNSEAASNSYLVYGMAVGNFGGGSPGILASGFGALTLFRGSSNGMLQAPKAVAYSGPVGAIAAGDFNGDGIADAAVVSGNTVEILLSNQSGSLTPLASVSSGSPTPAMLAAADFDGDGKIDLALLNSGTPGSLAILRGAGDGSFHAAVNIPVGVTPTSLLAADLNGDGKPDLVFADAGTNGSGGAVYVAMNQGGGVFRTPVSVSSGIYPAVGVGDVNGDGRPDLVIAADVNTGGAHVNWLQGNGDGTFQAPVSITALEVNANSVLVQDFNGDGRADLALAQQSADLVFLTGNGDGTFSPQNHLLGGAQPIFLASGDLNGDGKPDLVAGGYTVAVLLNAPAPNLQATVVSAANPSAKAIAPGSLAVAYGLDLATAVTGGASLPLPSTFGGTAVSIVDATGAGTAAPLLYVNPLQVNFEVPAGVATGPAKVTVYGADGTRSAANVQIATVAPGVFPLNGSGLAAAYLILYHADGTQTVEQVYSVTSGGAVVAAPVSLGSANDLAYLSLFGTGFQAAGTGGVTVSVGGTNVQVASAGPQGGFVGLDQANVLLPQSLAGKGNVTIQLTANGIAANPMNIIIQ